MKTNNNSDAGGPLTNMLLVKANMLVMHYVYMYIYTYNETQNNT